MTDEQITSILNGAVEVLKVLFSWIVLMPIAVIVSGIALNKAMPFPVDKPQTFRIPLILFSVEADRGEVILGMAGFIACLLLFGFFGGPQIYEIFRTNFGVDPGQFNALCIFSSFCLVVISFVIYILSRVIFKRADSRFIPDKEKHDRLIEQLGEKESK